MARHRERAAPEQQELDPLRLDDVALDGARLEPQVLGQDLDDAVAAGHSQHIIRPPVRKREEAVERVVGRVVDDQEDQRCEVQ